MPTERCLEDGLGPDIFDCSGFILRVLSDVADLDLGELAQQYRHVRDMWQDSAENPLFCRISSATPTNLAAGGLLVTARRYTIGGQYRAIPGHIGIVTEGGEAPSFIHASAESGLVEERSLNRPGRRQLAETMVGCLAFVGQDVLQGSLSVQH
jgi:cell wall-associated NlpC family hydrolase